MKKFLLDTLFPIACLSCGKEDVWLCDDCAAKINLLSFQVCPACEKIITDSGKPCADCKSGSALDALLVATKYKKNDLDRIVHLYKYRFIEDLGVALGKIIVKNILASDLPLPDIIIPVPLHPRRLRWRGFNQSKILAEHISRNLAPGLEIPVAENILKRKKYTPPQMKIKKYSERKKNLKDAFSIEDAAPIKNNTILLIDDIATTGTTLSECAEALKRAGAKKVFAAIIARQELNDKTSAFA